MRVGIVGGGVFGSVIGAALYQDGCKVTVFDSRKENAGSLASGFLMKPSWFSNMKSKDSEASLQLLDELYGLQELKFRVGPLKTTVFRVDRNAVLKNPDLKYVNEKVEDISSDGKIFTHPNDDPYKFDLVVVAAGVWCHRFFDLPELDGKTGVSFQWKHDGPYSPKLEKNLISVWAPYKQVVAFNVPGENEIWAGDGTAILQKNWKEGRVAECMKRVCKATGLPHNGGTFQVGIRPYYKTKDPCHVEKRGHKLWLATGGSKNGTIGAAWAANKILECPYD